MAKFVEFIDGNNTKRCINVDWIIEVHPYSNEVTQIWLGIPQISGSGQSYSRMISINVNETYKKVKHKLDD